VADWERSYLVAFEPRVIFGLRSGRFEEDFAS